MTYRNNLNPSGVTINGSPDTLTSGAPPGSRSRDRRAR